MKAYQCSKCSNLCDYDEICKKNFRPFREKQWHEKFSWERDE
ncbi:hypothetical protein [Clostridium sporogenes]|nr:hypothetical protein [Clostridium sporogenes]